MFVDRGYFYTIPGDGLAANLIGLAGGMNVAADADVSTPLTPAELRQAAPQVYLAVAGSGVTLQGLRRSPATRYAAGGAVTGGSPCFRTRSSCAAARGWWTRCRPSRRPSTRTSATDEPLRRRPAGRLRHAVRAGRPVRAAAQVAARAARAGRGAADSRARVPGRDGVLPGNCHSAGDVHSLAELRRRCGECWPASWASARPGEQLVPVLADAVSLPRSTTTSRRPCGRSPTAGS